MHKKPRSFRNLSRRPARPAAGNGRLQRLCRRAAFVHGGVISTTTAISWCYPALMWGAPSKNDLNRATRRALVSIGRPDKGERALDGKREKLEKRAITLAKAYKKYRKRGGNRSLPDRILKELGKTRIEDLDRATIRGAACKLSSSEIERAELVDAIDEIAGLDRGAPRSDRPAMPGRFDPYLYWTSRKAEFEAETKRLAPLKVRPTGTKTGTGTTVPEAIEGNRWHRNQLGSHLPSGWR